MSEFDPSIFHFETNEDTVLIGDAAYEAAIAAGVHPLDIQPLRDVLEQPEATVVPEAHTNRAEVDDWTKRDYISYGHWLAKQVCALPDGTPRITSPILRNAGILGIGPAIKRFEAESRFGSLSEYYAALDMNHLYQRNRFRHWTMSDYVQYLHDVSEAEGGLRPTRQVLQAHALQGKGPTMGMITKATGVTLMELQERIGFPVIHSWSEEDYIDWGVRFMTANDGKAPTARALDILSQRDRGPAAKTIFLKFGAMSTYKEMVIARHEEAEIHRQKTLAENKALLAELTESGRIPAGLYEDQDIERSMARCAKYLVATTLLGHVPSHDLTHIAQTPPTRFVQRIQTHNAAISAGEVELTALEMGFYDAIWPMNHDLEHLRLTA